MRTIQKKLAERGMALLVALALPVMAMAAVMAMIIMALPSVDAALSCTITDGACAAGYTSVLRMSNQTDAHAEFTNQSNYGFNICCRDTVSAVIGTSTSGVRFLRLANVTDSHVALPNQSDFAESAYISTSSGTLACTFPANAGTCPAENTCIATISNDTDATVANCTNGYATTVCCSLTADAGGSSSSSSSSSGGGGGGGGGGGATSAAAAVPRAAAGGGAVGGEAVSEEAVRSWAEVVAHDVQEFKPGVAGIESIAFALGRDAVDVSLRVAEVATPESSPTLSAYKTIQIEEHNIVELEQVTFEFKVERTWLEREKMSAAEVVLYRLEGGQWNEQPTEGVSEDAFFVYYKARPRGLSIFIIGKRGTCTDALRNQDESAIDCGGTLCERCPAGAICIQGSDCASGNCYQGFCSSLGAGCTHDEECGAGYVCVEGTCTGPRGEQVTGAAPARFAAFKEILAQIREAVRASTETVSNTAVRASAYAGAIAAFVLLALVMSFILYGSYYAFTSFRRSSHYAEHKRFEKYSEEAQKVARVQEQARQLSLFIKTKLTQGVAPDALARGLIEAGWSRSTVEQYVTYFAKEARKTWVEVHGGGKHSIKEELHYIDDELQNIALRQSVKLLKKK